MLFRDLSKSPLVSLQKGAIGRWRHRNPVPTTQECTAHWGTHTLLHMTVKEKKEMVSPTQLGTGDSFQSILGLSTFLLWMFDIIDVPRPWPRKQKWLSQNPPCPALTVSSLPLRLRLPPATPTPSAASAATPTPSAASVQWGLLRHGALLGQPVLRASSPVTVSFFS